MTMATTLFLVLFITISLIPILKRFALRAHLLDIPNERKVHSLPVPKVGGLAMALGFFIPVLIWLPLDHFVIALLLGSGVLIVTGLVDDRSNLGYKAKFLAQTAAALIVILYGGIRIDSLGTLLPEGTRLPLAISIPLTTITIVCITNAINLADGLDGLAGGICLIIFLCLSALAYGAADTTTIFLCLAMLGAIFGFLAFNTHPASVFMGDTGSLFLGFMAVVLSLRITQGNTPLSPTIPLFVIGIPIIDTMMVTLERIRAGRPLFVADKNHFHHKLIKTGFFHTEAVFIIYVLQSLFVLCAYFLRFYDDCFLLGLYGLLLSAIVGFFLVIKWKSFTFKRYLIIDKVIKGKLRFLKNQTLMLQIATIILTYILPLTLFADGILIKNLPQWISYGALTLIGIILTLWGIRSRFLHGMVRIVLFFTIPTIIYFSQNAVRSMHFKTIYLICLSTCILSAFIMIRFDRRQKCFKASPMDYLILVLVIGLPILLEPIMEAVMVRTFLVQTIIFQYCYQIVLDARHKAHLQIIATTIGALIIIALKGLIL